MKKIFSLAIALMLLITLVALTASPVLAGKPVGAKIQDGTILALDGTVITVGYDQFGYNYQAHLFNGRYCDVDRVLGGDYADVQLVMKWNDAWLSNMDRDGDNLLDRPASSIGSGAWCTNHQSGTNEDGSKWVYFVKIVAVPADAYFIDTNENGKADNYSEFWYTADGTEIGPSIWGAFAIVQQISNDSAYDEHGVLYKSPAGPGLGKW